MLASPVAVWIRRWLAARPGFPRWTDRSHKHRSMTTVRSRESEITGRGMFRRVGSHVSPTRGRDPGPKQV